MRICDCHFITLSLYISTVQELKKSQILTLDHNKFHSCETIENSKINRYLFPSDQ